MPIGAIDIRVQHQAVYLEKMSLEYEQKLDFLLTEIIQTEQTYVEDLEVIIYDYMRPAEEEGIGCRSIKNEDFVKTVFSNIEDVHYFAFYLAEQLEEWSPNVGQCFVNLKPEFDVYIEYCTNFKVALEYLEKARKRHSEVDEWLSEQQKASGKALGLETYLLKPLQRLLKYPLLLKQLLKYVSHSSSDYAAIASAHADIQAC
ncbi:hypothetical protein SARC_06650 [Sphaeroforma arctica JP610]|uniref:DH domain-containing protein n=1 Tax=Sphaeroforma arctica JP610 TaxID=667725 RepID=A0A0L0FWI7_9EUKA|nr:hypothetical protein SARC_06650 [Sphaeroforma arctica JP610]KNC81004.1 hypothetical protein SARC_06650 [Sphaeroforma arctica JP610]|eukprot:XP_014154906.1 hypothetical protein SARC_06650 [Sphaeroforma arctica JP610]